MPYSALELATAFIKTGELTDALDALNQHLTDNPSDDEIRRLRIETLIRLNQLQAALNDLDTLPTLTSDDLARKSVVLERLGDNDAALQAVRQSVNQQPENQRLNERLVHLLQTQGKYQEALEIAKTMPSDWRWLQWAGDLALQAAEFQQAVGYFTQALDKLASVADLMEQTWAKPLQARLLLARGEVYRKTAQFDAAKSDYNAAEALIPDDPMIPFYRGLMAAVEGKEAVALDYCQQAYHQAPARLKEEMRRELQSDPRYATIAAQL